jgi:hypothetical protein
LADLYLVLALLLNGVPFFLNNDFAYERVDWPLPTQVSDFFSPLASISPRKLAHLLRLIVPVAWRLPRNSRAGFSR